jgi:hypothetical protein
MSLYEEQYLNCFQYQYISYLREKGAPVEWMYYAAFEDTRLVYKEIVLNQKDRFLYPNQIDLANLEGLFGCERRQIFGLRLAALTPRITELLRDDHTLFIAVDEFGIPHSRHYGKQHNIHSLMIVGCEMRGGKLHYLVRDNVGHQFIEKWYPADTVAAAYDQAAAKSDNAVSYLEFKTLPTSLVSPPAWLFQSTQRRFDQLADTFLLYKAAMRVFGGMTNSARISKEMTAFGHAFGIICGSRYAFGSYLSSVGCSDQALLDWLEEAHRLAHQVKLALYAAVSRGRANGPSLSEKCMRLQTLDRFVIEHCQRVWHTV